MRWGMSGGAMGIWNSLSYMVQLLAACLLFVLPARKRRSFLPLALGGGAVLLFLAYWINIRMEVPESGIMPFAYWFFYVASAVFFSWLCLSGTVVQAFYCAISACGMQHIAFDVYLILVLLGWSSPVLWVLAYAAVYFLIFYFVARKLPENGSFVVNTTSIVPMVTIILLMWLLSIFENSSMSSFQAAPWHRIIYRIMDGVCCFYVMWVQMSQKERSHLQRELDGIHAVFRQQKKQYEVTRDTIETINRKCHDLKHQIRILRETSNEKEKEEYFDEIENAIMIYDTALATGNRALDTVLMEKGMFCQNHGIQWSCMADGKNLGFMKAEDIYAMFGNALDNAVRAVLELKDKEKRVISAKIIYQDHILVIQIQNYYEGVLQMEDGLPLTTKKNKVDHGYGMKSIRYTAEKYNGTITTQTADQIFTLQILIPTE